jgi:Myb/SANT-like DNA-binding protein
MSAENSSGRLNWTVEMEEKLLDSLLQSQTNGYQADSGSFKATAWNSAIEAVKTVTHQTLNVQKMKTKYDTLKQDWKAWRHFVEQSGHGWDAEKMVPTAAPEVLRTYFEAHPRAKKFQEKTIPNAEKLQALLHGALATGEFAASSLTSRTPNVISQLAGPQPADEGNGEDVDDEYVTDWSESSPETPETPLTQSPFSSSPPPAEPNSNNTTGSSQAGAATTPGVATTAGAATTTGSNLRLRRRAQMNATQANRRRQRRSGGHALADAVTEAVGELRSSTIVNRDPMGRVAEILVAEFQDLSFQQHNDIYTRIQSEGRAHLFVAWNTAYRRNWVDTSLFTDDE